MKHSYLKNFFFYFLLASLVAGDSFSVFAQSGEALLRQKMAAGASGASNARSFLNGASDGSGLDNLTLSPMPVSGPGGLSSVYYNVHILGQVRRPGVYKILPSDRATDAIKYAGDI